MVSLFRVRWVGLRLGGGYVQLSNGVVRIPHCRGGDSDNVRKLGSGSLMMSYLAKLIQNQPKGCGLLFPPLRKIRGEIGDKISRIQRHNPL